MEYVRNAWYVAAWSHDIAAHQPHGTTILNELLVIYRGESGQLVALEDRCVHRLAPLSLGRCEGDRIRCMYHGLLYDSEGRVVEIPGQDMIPPRARVRSYPVIVRHGWVWVWMGDAELADEALIPPAIGPDHPDFVQGTGVLDYDAEARLINDNLLDFSHLTYVHENSFKSGAAYAQQIPRIVSLERGVRYERWIENSLGSAARKSDVPTDSFMTYDFLIPGILLLRSAIFPLGTARALGHARPDFETAIGGDNFTSQAVTPMQERTSRYFFCWGPRRDHGGEERRDLLMGLAAVAFDEDKRMIEAQQRVINATPRLTVMPTAHDRAVTLYNRLVKRLV